jgi:hypothetical protein
MYESVFGSCVIDASSYAGMISERPPEVYVYLYVAVELLRLSARIVDAFIVYAIGDVCEMSELDIRVEINERNFRLEAISCPEAALTSAIRDAE